MSDPDILAKPYEGKTILITGAGGYLAGALMAALERVDCRIVRLSRRRLPTMTAKVACIVDTEGDLRHGNTWDRLPPDVDVVFHLAADTSVYRAEQDPVASLEANVVPMLRLLAYCRDRGRIPTVVMAGTATECGLVRTLPVDETATDHPITVYDLHKLFAEMHLKQETDSGHIRGTCLRLANIYGSGAMASSVDRGILNRIVRAALSGRPIQVFGDGSQLRDYVYLDDAVSAFLQAGAAPERVKGRHFIVASGDGHTLRVAFQMVADSVEVVAQRRVAIEHVPWPPGSHPIEFRNFVGNPEALRRAIGWRAMTTLREGIERTVKAALEWAPSP